MNVTMDNSWNHEANNFAMDNNDYEKAFESYISDVEDEDGEFLINNGSKIGFKWLFTIGI